MAQTPHSACQWFGVAVEMKWTDLSSKTTRMSLTHFGRRPVRFSTVLQAFWPDLLVDVDDVGDLDILAAGVVADVIAAAAVAADHGTEKLVVGARALGAGDAAEHRGQPPPRRAWNPAGIVGVFVLLS